MLEPRGGDYYLRLFKLRTELRNLPEVVGFGGFLNKYSATQYTSGSLWS